jgi:hypothetical protein
MKATIAIVLFAGLSSTALAPQALAQVDTQRGPPGPPNQLSAHRIEALKKCTDGMKFASDRYVNCMTREGENP